MRDDFLIATKDVLSKRVGGLCSNPGCRKGTSGPRNDPAKALNIGVAAHVCAASPGGPRYVASMPASERRAAENGIWLCQNCAKLVDSDPHRYSVSKLYEWKITAEESARQAVESNALIAADAADGELIRFFAQCLDRPAFQDRFRDEGSIEDFDRAIEDTITAINTGCLRARDRSELSRARGKVFLKDGNLRTIMDEVVVLLRTIRNTYNDALKAGTIHINDQGDGQVFYCIHGQEFADQMDEMRANVLDLFGQATKKVGFVSPKFPLRPGKVPQYPDLRVLARLYKPDPVEDGYTYLRLDTEVVNNGNSTASNIIIKISSPPDVQTVAEYFKGRQATTPGEGEFNMSIAPVEADGYRTATYMLATPPLQGDSVISFASGTAVVFAKNGNYVFRWSARCPEERDRGTSGTFAVDVLNGTAVLR